MPKYERTMIERLRHAEDQIQKLWAANSRREKLNVVQGGTLDVLASNGSVVASIGEAPDGSVATRVYYPDGSRAFLAGTLSDGTVETLMYRDDESLAFRIGGAPGQPQFFAGYDRSGNIVVSDDTVSAVGLATPFIPWGPFQSNSAPLDVTSSGSFTTLQSALGRKVNPRISMQILGRASDGSTSGEIRVIDEDGTQIGGTITVAAGAFQYYNIAPTALPGAFGDSKSLNIQGRVTGGGGTIGARGIVALGDQS